VKGISLKSDIQNASLTQNEDSHASKKTYVLFSLSWLQRTWQRFVQELASADEVKVWQKRDRYGNTYWKVYDPMTGKHFYSGSETDAIAWIEQLYRGQGIGN
jgi:hypothetical protein